MSSQAITIRDAIISRLEVATAFTPYGKIRRTPLPQAQPDDLPILSVFVMNEQSSRDGGGVSTVRAQHHDWRVRGARLR